MKFADTISRSIPAIVMGTGVVGGNMLADNAPEHVKYGGACLLLMAAILADLQNNKKLGITNRVVSAMRTLPGCKDVDEGTALGLLCVGACAALGGPEAVNIASGAEPTVSGAVRVGYNALLYLPTAAFDFRSTAVAMEKYLGKEVSFSYADADGVVKKTAPVNVSRLVQQVACLGGAAGMTTCGVLEDSADIRFTGSMFMLSNGLNIATMLKAPLAEACLPKAQALLGRLYGAAQEGAGLFADSWKELRSEMAGTGPSIPEIEVTAARVLAATLPLAKEVRGAALAGQESIRTV